MRRLVAVSMVLATGAAIVGACSSTSDSSTGGDGTTTTSAGAPTSEGAANQTSGAPDPCSLLTTADLASATGVTFGEGQKNETLSSGSQVVCDWASTGSDFATAQVLIVPGGADAIASQKSGAGQISATSDVSVPGADSAYQTEEGSIVGMAIGADFVQVSYIPSGAGSVNAATLQLAEVAAANCCG